MAEYGQGVYGVDIYSQWRFPVDSGSYSLTGSDVDFYRVLIPESGTYTLSGSLVNLLKSSIVDANSGNYSISGTDVDLLKDSILFADSVSYSLSGSDITLTEIARPTFNDSTGSSGLPYTINITSTGSIYGTSSSSNNETPYRSSE